jgi:hypothetical protein
MSLPHVFYSVRLLMQSVPVKSSQLLKKAVCEAGSCGALMLFECGCSSCRCKGCWWWYDIVRTVVVTVVGVLVVAVVVVVLGLGVGLVLVL